MAAQKQGRQVAGCNYVANDEIWKSHVHMEITAAKKWPQNWGFMTQSYKELVQDSKDSRKAAQVSKVELPEELRIRQITPIETYIKVGKSPPYPETTMQEIGWRSSQPGCMLDIYGGKARGKGGLIRQLNWPREGII